MKQPATVLLALSVGTALHLASCLLLPPAPAAFSYGLDYQALSADPFALAGKLPQRILGPLLAWLCGLGGDRYPRFMVVCGSLLLATVFWFCRQRGSTRIDAGLIAAAVAASGANQTYKYVVGFPDQLSFALLFLALANVRRPAAFWACNLASLLNHEMLLFFLPWLCWERRRQQPSHLRGDVIGLAIVGSLYAAFRWYVAAHAPQQQLNSAWYTGQSLFPWGTVWLWLMTTVYWVTDFGPLLLVLAWGVLAARPRGENRALLTFLGGLLAIYAAVFVYDFFRFGSALCVPLVLASLRFLDGRRRRQVYAGAIAAALGWFWWWHPDAPTNDTRVVGYRAVGDIDGKVLQCIVTQNPPASTSVPIDYARVLVEVPPQIAGLLFGLAAALSVFLGLGILAARRPARERPPTAAPSAVDVD